MTLNKLNIQVGGFSGEATLTIKEHIVDILMLVAGTQDPVNINPDKHAANTKYWQSSTANLWSELQKLKPQFIDLNLSEKFFSWTGDNNEKERNEAAERLLDLITRLYLKSKEGKTLKFEGKEVHLHLIGHSHGGNVINQFTELITNSEMLAESKYPIEELPEKWKIKSITYLSTPFFNDKHQLNHTKLHQDCKFINVRNEYDITQRFIADFSLYNLEYIIQAFDKDEALKAVEKINLILDSNIYTQLFETMSWINKTTEGPLIWERTVLLLENVIIILDEIIKCISSLKTSTKLTSEKATFVGIIEGLIESITVIKDEFDRNTINRDGNYGLAEFINDCEPTTSLASALDLANKLLAIDKDGGAKGSALLNFLAKVFAEGTGLTDSIDDTSWNPKKQLQGKKFIPVDITKDDDYDKRGKKSNFDGFAKGIEGSLKEGNLQEMLLRLFSQFIEPFDLVKVQLILNMIISRPESFLFNKTRKKLTLLSKNINRYHKLVKKFNADLVAEQDLTEAAKKKKEAAKKEVKEDIDSNIVFKEESIKEFNKAYKEITNRKSKTKKSAADKEDEKEIPGTIGYLATTSHGLSHTFFWKDLEKGLRDSFSSGINSGYKG